ncbi:MAG: LytR C-terminal domain-containing protein [Candidatus Chisholmbacteria bacterium]|nr:LytR C-terminal domain-containing protein [Candidatus Chisholmbacteria bacterium]
MPDKKSKSKHPAANKEPASLDHSTPAPEDTLESDALEPETARPQFQVVEEAENLSSESERNEPLEPQEAPAEETPAKGWSLPDRQAGASDGNPQRPSMANPYQTSGFTHEGASMTDSNPNQSAPHDFRFNREPQRKFPWWIVIILLALALIGVGAWRFFFASSREPQNQPSVTDILIEPPATSSASPSPEPQEELKREDIKVQVLNGSGIAGEAGKLAAILEAAGFEDIDTGNAQNYDYTGITIQVKEGEDEIAELVESDLRDDYEDIDIDDTLDADSEFAVVVIRGSQPGDEDILGAQDETPDTDQDTEAATSSGENN